MWIPATAIPPSPTAAAQRLTDPDRTSPAAKMPGRLVSSGPGCRLLPRHDGASTTSAPVLINPFSSRSISGGNQSVHGRAPIMENPALACLGIFQFDLFQLFSTGHFTDLSVVENLDVFASLYPTRKIVRHLV